MSIKSYLIFKKISDFISEIPIMFFTDPYTNNKKMYNIYKNILEAKESMDIKMVIVGKQVEISVLI
jgi:hypothetical protein